MNRSGLSVASALAEWHTPPEGLVVAHDDLDLEAGRLKVKTGGGHGGHNGLKSIEEETGSGGFARLRLGIGRPPAGTTTIDHVLGPFKDDEWLDLQVMLDKGVQAAESLLTEGVGQAMNRFNKR